MYLDWGHVCSVLSVPRVLLDPKFFGFAVHGVIRSAFWAAWRKLKRAEAEVNGI